MRRIAIIAVLATLALLMAPAQALPQKAYVSGDLVINPIGDMPGAVFRNAQVDEERYVFLIPLLIEFKDVDNSGNFTPNDVVVAVAPLHGLSTDIDESDGLVNITRSGDVNIVGEIGVQQAYVEVYLTVSNSTLNEAKRGMKIIRPRASEDDHLVAFVIFKAVDPQMNMHQCKRKHEHRTMLKLQQGKTEAHVEYEDSCYCDGVEKHVSVYAFSRGDERDSTMYHYAHMKFRANVATQIVFPYGQQIVYDPKIAVSTISFRTTTTGITLIIAAAMLIIAAIAIVLRNHSR